MFVPVSTETNPKAGLSSFSTLSTKSKAAVPSEIVPIKGSAIAGATLAEASSVAARSVGPMRLNPVTASVSLDGFAHLERVLAPITGQSPCQIRLIQLDQSVAVSAGSDCPTGVGSPTACGWPSATRFHLNQGLGTDRAKIAPSPAPSRVKNPDTLQPYPGSVNSTPSGRVEGVWMQVDQAAESRALIVTETSSGHYVVTQSALLSPQSGGSSSTPVMRRRLNKHSAQSWD